MRKSCFEKVFFRSIVVLFAIVLITACSDDETHTASGAKANESNNTHKSGGVVTMPISADPTFNPWHPNAYIESIPINRILFNGLTKPGKDLAPAPDLATNWEVSDDELEWTFYLRDDVKWHDGEPFTAEDVAYTFNDVVLADIGANASTSYNPVDVVEAIDEHTVLFRLNQPFAALPTHLGYNAGILPKHKFYGEEPWELTAFNKNEPIGTGPFKLDKYLSGQGVELVPNTDYFDNQPYLDRVEFKILSDINTHIAQALSQEINLFVLEDIGSVDRIKESGFLEIYPQHLTRFDMMSLHQVNPLFQDVKVRQAFMHAVDRQAIIDVVLHGYGTIADSGISPSLEKYYTDDVTHYEYNPNKALELFAEAGWEDTNGDGILDKDGESFSFTLDIGQIGESEAIGQMIHQNLLDIGLDVTLNVLEWNTLIDKVAVQRDFDAYLSWWNMPSDPDILPYFHSSAAEGGFNRPGFKDPELDQLLELGQRTSDPDERQEIYYDVQKMISEKVPYHFLWYPQELQVRNDHLKGVPELQYRDALHYINEWWIEE